MIPHRVDDDESVRRSRYATAVYVSIALGGMLLTVLAIIGGASYGDVLDNFGTGMVTTSVIFFFLRYFLLDRDRESERKLDRLTSIIAGEYDGEAHFLERRTNGVSRIIERLSASKDFVAAGYALNRLLEEAGNELLELVAQGGRVRLMVVSADDTAGQLIRLVSDSRGSTHNVRHTIDLAREIYRTLSRRQIVDPQFELRTLNWIPSTAIYASLATSRRGDPGWMQVEIYPANYNTPPGLRPIFYLSEHANDAWFHFFRNQFESLWASANSVPLSDLSGGPI